MILLGRRPFARQKKVIFEVFGFDAFALAKIVSSEPPYSIPHLIVKLGTAAGGLEKKLLP